MIICNRPTVVVIVSLCDHRSKQTNKQVHLFTNNKQIILRYSVHLLQFLCNTCHQHLHRQHANESRKKAA